MLKWFSVAKNCLVQIGPQNGGFRKFKDLIIKYSHRDPKRHFLTRKVFYDVHVFCVKIRLGCRPCCKKTPQTKKKLVTQEARKNRVFGEQKPLKRSLQKFACLMPSAGRNHACQFWWWSVKGFWCGEGSNFGLFHWLASSPL